ncbi:MAG: hypothetical protein GF418_13445 [Chitinivibrionales bacterium]|nr:hypothetical protein [Chitinivibrionales bacterium]MBD3396624.1 hypothetical protein [Chitinivibrionales bacterium]
MRISNAAALVFVLFFSLIASAANPGGWACFAGNNRVYRVQMNGDLEDLTGDVNAKHARWSADGRQIFYIRGNNEIWAMHNNGDNNRKIGSGNIASGSSIAAYRPDADYVLSVEGGDFYKLNSRTPGKTLICASGSSVYGEIAISQAGNRIAFRNGGLYVIDFNPATADVTASDRYADACSAGLSPDGLWMIRNGGSHTVLEIHSYTSGNLDHTIGSGTIGGTWDNQAFAVNSNDWICCLMDNGVGSNSGSRVAVVHRTDESQQYEVVDWSGFNTMYPDFFVGDLPSPVMDDPTSPSAPTNLAVTGTSNTSVTLGWDAGADAESGIKHYIVYFEDALHSTVSSTSATITGLTRATIYENIYVKAVNGVDSVSAASNTVSATTADNAFNDGTFYVEAASGALSNGMTATTQDGSQAAEVIYGTTGDLGAAGGSLSKAEYTVDLAAGDWYAWGRFYFGGSANSFWIQVDGGTAERFGNGEESTASWHWEGEQGAKLSLGTLGEGTHTITISGREVADNCLLDMICLTTDAAFVPDDGATIGAPPRETAYRHDGLRRSGRVTLYTLSGKKVGTYSLVAGKIQAAALAGRPAGTYIAHQTATGRTFSVKVGR